MSAYVHMRLVDACLRLVRVWCNPKAVLVLLVLLVESIRLHMAVPCCTICPMWTAIHYVVRVAPPQGDVGTELLLVATTTSTYAYGTYVACSSDDIIKTTTAAQSRTTLPLQGLPPAALYTRGLRRQTPPCAYASCHEACPRPPP